MENNHGSQPKTRFREGDAKTIKPPLTVVDGDFLGDYLINIHFSDGTQRVVDFARAFSQLKGYYAQYQQPHLFQNFAIDGGNLVWGEDWDVIYPTGDLYTGKIG